jgi:hypothetical protein
VDHQHVFANIEAVHRTDFHTIHVFAVDAIFGDDIGHWRDSLVLSLSKTERKMAASDILDKVA